MFSSRVVAPGHPFRRPFLSVPLAFATRFGFVVASTLLWGGHAQATDLGRGGAKPAVTALQGATTLPSFSAIIERIAPAVVSVRVKADPAATPERDNRDNDESEASQPQKDGDLDAAPSQRFSGPGFTAPMPFRQAPPQDGPLNRKKDADAVHPVQGQGSGFFITSDGYIVTNNHVVANAIKVQVVTDSGDILDAKLIGSDVSTDLALLKVDGARSFPTVAFSRADPKVGDWVLALGNPFGLDGTVTAGIVSATGRDIGLGAYDNFIQIDASINHGNSGGPTANQAGEIVGVNTAIFSPSGGSVGIAFAIPASVVENVAAQLKEKGAVTRSTLGVQVQPLTPELADGLGLKKARGALVSTPMPGGPADQAGIKRGDVILKVNDGEVKDGPDFARKIAALAPSTKVRLTVFRDDKARLIDAKVTELKDTETEAPASGEALPQAEIGALGLRVSPAIEGRESPGGLAIVGVRPDGRGADAGLLRGDVLLSANGAPLMNPAALEKALRNAKAAGKKHAVALVQRGGTQGFVAIPTDMN